MSKPIERLEIKNIKLDKGTQPRVTLDQEVIAEWTQLLKEAPNPFPPVTVFRDEAGHLYLADGFHRIFAHKGAKLKEIDAEIIPGALRDAILHSVSVNATHGVRRTNKDKRRAVLTLLHDKEWSQWSDNAIAKYADVSGTMVASLRPAAKSPATRKARRGGKEVSVSTKNIGKKGGKSARNGKKGESKPPTDLEDKELVKVVAKITNAVGGEQGGAVRKAIETGSLALSKGDLKTWAETSEARIRKAAPLITELGFKPARAFAFLDKNIDLNSKVEELINHALSRGGQFELKLNGYLITVVDDKKYSVATTHKGAATA